MSSNVKVVGKRLKKVKLPKVCKICGDKSTGSHFGAISCEGCKGFFRRSTQKGGQFSCLFKADCTITKLTRKHCQACRYKKCLELGMRKDLVMTEEQVIEKRELIQSNREKRRLIKIEMEKEMELKQVEQKLNMQQISCDAQSCSNLNAQQCSSNLSVQNHGSSVQNHGSNVQNHGSNVQNHGSNVQNHGSNAQNHGSNVQNHGSDVKNGGVQSCSNWQQHKMPVVKPLSKKPEQRYWMTMDQRVFIEILLKHHKDSYDFDYKDFESFRGLDQIFVPDTPPNMGFAWYAASKNPALLEQANTSSEKPKDIFTENRASQPSTSRQEPGPSSSSFSLHGSATVSLTSTQPRSTTQQPQPPPSLPQMNLPHPEKMQYIQGFLHSQGLSFHILKDQKSIYKLQHFCDIMSWGIKKVIEFCKGIPEFIELSVADQIVLLKGGCLEMLVIRSYFAFSIEGNSYKSEKFQYNPSDFITAGASKEFIQAYNDVHCRMRKIKIKVAEICLLLALILFSPDRPDLSNRKEVEKTQNHAAETLQMYEYIEKPRDTAVTDFTEIMLILPKLRNISSLFSQDIHELQRDFESDMNPLIFELITQSM